MFHGHMETGNGPQLQTVGYFFAWFVGSILTAYYAMKFTAARREALEKAAKRKKSSY
jgi:hypothetical protein